MDLFALEALDTIPILLLWFARELLLYFKSQKIDDIRRMVSEYHEIARGLPLMREDISDTKKIVIDVQKEVALIGNSFENAAKVNQGVVEALKDLQKTNVEIATTLKIVQEKISRS